jgi:hypothetical protein
MTDLATEIAALRREVDRLKSRDTIIQQLTRYGRGQEWLDFSLMDEVFWDDAAIDFGFFKGVWRDYRPVLWDIERAGEATYHLTTAPQIAFEGENKAYVECYGLAGGRNGATTQIYGGRYLHVFERRDGVWKSASCTYLMDWTMKQTEEAKASEALTGINRVTDRSPNNPWFRRMGADVTG